MTATTLTASESKFILRIAEDVHATSFEIQWLQQENDPEELSAEETFPIGGNRLELDTPQAPFFRLRARNSLDQPGPWSPVYRSSDFWLAVNEELPLGEDVPAEPEPEPEPQIPVMELLFANESSYLKDGIITFPADTGGEIWLSLNKQPEFLYKEDIQLEHDREYELEMVFRNLKGRELSREIHRFKTDLLAPRTRRVVYWPAFRGKQICLTPESKIIFHAFDQNSGVSTTMCRFNQQSEFQSCVSPIKLPDSFDRNCRSCVTLEYYSVDHAGNKEKVHTEKFGVVK